MSYEPFIAFRIAALLAISVNACTAFLDVDDYTYGSAATAGASTSSAGGADAGAAGAGGGLVSCEDEYGSVANYILCVQKPASCEFYYNLPDTQPTLACST